MQEILWTASASREALNVSYQQFYRLLKSKDIRPVKRGVYRKSQIEALIREKEIDATLYVVEK